MSGIDCFVVIPVGMGSFAARVGTWELTRGLETRVPSTEWVNGEATTLFRLERDKDWEELLHRMLRLTSWPMALWLIKDRLRRLRTAANRASDKAKGKAEAKGKAKAKAKKHAIPITELVEEAGEEAGEAAGEEAGEGEEASEGDDTAESSRTI